MFWLRNKIFFVWYTLLSKDMIPDKSFVRNELTLFLLAKSDLSSADDLCKQIGPMSSPTKCLGLIWIQTV